MFQKQIAQVYDQKASEYNADRLGLADQKYVRRFEQLLKPRSLVLDLGCGDGSAVAAPLLRLNHLVIGLDISPVQIALARKNYPRGEFFCRDISTLKPHEYQVDGVTTLYTIFHTPRAQHAKLLKIIASFLPTGGALLVTMGDREFEGWHEFYGTKVWSSHFGPQTNARLVREAGFQIILDELHHSNRETHQIILATKNIAPPSSYDFGGAT